MGIYRNGFGAFLGVYLLFVAVVGVLGLIGWIMIIRRAGYSGAWVLIGFVPVVNLIMFLVFAFKEWPVQRETRELRAWADQVHRQAAAQAQAAAPPPMPPQDYWPGPGYPQG